MSGVKIHWWFLSEETGV